MKKTTLIAILVLSTLLISCSEKVHEPINYSDKDKSIVETLNVAGSEVRLTVATTNIGRDKASEEASIEQNAEIYSGILFVYDGKSPIVFRQKLNSYSTDIAFLDETGKITSFKELLPTPHNPERIKSYLTDFEQYKYFASQRGENIDASNEEAYKQYFRNAAVGEGFIKWAFPQTSVVKVKYALQLPGGFFSKHNMQIGQKIELTEKIKKLTGESTKPVIEFVYKPKAERNDRTEPKKALFTVDIAETLEKRASALSADRIMQLKKDEIIALVWKTKRQINFNANDNKLVKPFYIVPIELPEQKRSIVVGEFVLIEPTLAPSTEIDARAIPAKQNDPSYRNYTFTSLKEYDCLLILSKESINSLNLSKNQFSFIAPPEFFDIKAEDDPEKFDVVYNLDKAENKVNAKVKLIQDEIGRRRGLKLANPMPKFEKDDEKEQISEGYLLRFDRVRKRPIYSAELRAPFDLALLDATNKIVRVIEIPDEKTLSTLKIYGELMEFSEVGYQSIWIMPFKWFNLNGLANVDDEGDVTYKKGELRISRTVTRTTPEPTRYKILINDIPVWVELLMTNSERTRGLQYVQGLKPDCGALFLYKNHNSTMEFWMPNCMIDISVLYIDKNWYGKTVKQMLHPFDPNVEESSEDRNNRPQNEETSLRTFSRQYDSKYKVEYAIEMERGWFVKNNLAKYKEDKYNTTETPDEYNTNIDLIGVPKVTIIKGSPVETFLEHVK